MNRSGAAALLWLSLTTAMAARAQTQLSLNAAVERALRTHPLLQAGTEKISASQAQAIQARLRPNPRLTLQTENWRGWGTPSPSPSYDIDTFAMISQTVETAGKRTQRTAVADAAIRHAQLERELLTRQIAARVKAAYWAAVAAVRIQRAHLDNAENFRGIVEYHENRVREGAMAEADLLKVRLESERLQLAVNGAELDVERTRIELFRAIGDTAFPALQLTDDIEGSLDTPPADPERAIANRIEIQLAQQVRTEAAANVRLQQSLARPDIDVMAGYKRTIDNHTFVGSVQTAIPWFNRNQGNIGAAEAQVRLADAEIAAESAIVRAEVAAAASAIQIRRRQVAVTLPTLRRQAEESARIALGAYREGGSDLIRLLDAQRVRIELDTLYYQTLAEYRQSIVALELALGENR